MTLNTTTLLDTSRLNDALACGYEVASEDWEALRIVLEQHPTGPSIYLRGPSGEVEIVGRAEIAEVHRALGAVLRG
ncbi:hypothetical protein [Caulobacter phage KcrB]|nr:hypothetical protein RW_GP040 [Caulobacter phage RW]WCA46344.1 hypothetical protein [Caulobacter phage KcrB]WCD56279.1 hypothetical protein [Caulobacter phage RLK]WNV48071.1 hypothetical protein GB2A_gp039 [Caulobacter phage GB2A]